MSASTGDLYMSGSTVVAPQMGYLGPTVLFEKAATFLFVDLKTCSHDFVRLLGMNDLAHSVFLFVCLVYFVVPRIGWLVMT